MSAASDRLASYYNGLAYNASTNPGGMAQGGHRTNFTPALQDVATVLGETATNATSAASSASSASTSATAAAASAAALAGTSATSVAVGTGAKTFTTQASKFFNAGAWLNIRSAANPSTNYMIGQVTSYSGTTLVMNITVTGGSGTFTDWVIELASAPGQTGGTGLTGALGPSPAIQFNFSTGLTDADPGNGLFKFDSATFAAVTFVYFDNLNKDSLDVQNWLDSLDDSTNSANRGRLYFMQPNAPTKVAYFKVTGAVIDGTGYRKVPVSPIIASSASIPFDSAAAVAIDFSPSGDTGLNGSGAGDVVGPASATDSAIALFNTTTGKLLKNSGNGIGTSGANVGLLNGNNTYSGTSAFSGAVSWTSTMIGTVANANALTVGPNGSTNPTLKVNTATASAATGISITGAAAAGRVAIAALSSGTDEGIDIDAKGAGTIRLGQTSTGLIALVRAVTMSAALTYGGVTLSSAVTGTGNMVLSASPTLTGTISAAALTLSGVLNYGGVALSAAVTGTGNMVLSASPTFTGTLTGAAATFSGTITSTQAIGSAQLDTSSQTFSSVADNANVAIAGTGGHFIIVSDGSFGNTGVYFGDHLGGYVMNTADASGTWVTPTTTPASGKQSVQWDGSANVRIYNHRTASISYRTMVIKVR